MAFPTTPLDITVEVALGAELSADPSGWAWTDATDYVLARDGITITRGGFDGQVQTPPSRCSFTVDNTDGRWVATNPTGAWYGQIRTGTPVRVKTGEGSTSVRWTGHLTALPPRWDPSETDRYIPVTASGILQRLQRGKTPLRSALVRMITGTPSPPVAYWPGEDGSEATGLAEFFGGRPMAITGRVVTLASDSPAGSNPLPEFTTSGGVIGTVPTRPATGEWSVAKIFKFPASPPAETVILQWFTSGTYPHWRVTLTPGGTDAITLQAFDAAGVMQINDAVAYLIDGVEPYGQWLMLVASALQDGPDVDYQMGIHEASGGFGVSLTETGITAGAVIQIREQANSKLDGMVAGHWAVWDTNVDPILANTLDVDAVFGYDGEEVGARVQRLAIEEGVGLAQFGIDLTNRMGPQTQDTFLNLLRECEAVNGGRLYEDLDPTFFDTVLSYKSGADYIANQDAVLTLNHDAGHLKDLEPTDDDQNLRNDVTATRSGASGTGSSARFVADSGNLKPSDVGTYDDSVSVNVHLDELLIHQAGWRVNIGTHEGLRFPVVTLNFARNPALIADWIDLDIGSRIIITNPPAGIAPDDIDLLIEGWVETFGPFTWTVQLNCSPYAPWHVFQLAETSGDTDPYLGRLVGDEAAALRIAISSSDVSAIMDPNFARWITGSGDDFPMNARLGGEVVTVSSIANGGTTFIAAGAAAHADNAAVVPALYAGNSIRQVIFVLAATRGAGTLATPAGYTRMPCFAASDNAQLFAKVHTGGGEVAPTITPSGGAAGDTVSAFTFGFSNMPNTLDSVADIVVECVPQLNASAQNIAYGGVYAQIEGAVNLIVAWKQDDYTSVAVPAGYTEILEASTTTGNDQSLYAAYRIDTVSTVANEGSLVVTGGASAISRSAAISVASGVQTLTISARAVNGVVKAHTVGTRIEVDDPAALGL